MSAAQQSWILKSATRGRSVAAALLTVALVLTVTSCSIGSDKEVAAGPIAMTPLSNFYTQKLSWRPCGQFDCTFLQVPMDYNQPDGKMIRLAVQRHRAGEPGQRIGSLVINPGGPGVSGTAAVADVVTDVGNTAVGQQFDIVGFDPRGVGSSEPAIRCYTPSEFDAVRQEKTPDNSPTGVALQLGLEKDYVAKCAQRSGVDLLANVGTRDAAKDMDVLRAALGDSRLTFLGWSYGTRLGYTYAEEFPRNVRALVLDGAEDPNQSLADSDVAQAAGFQHAFDAFAAWCATQAECPLGRNPMAAVTNYRHLVNPVNEKPVTLADQRKLSYSDAVAGTTEALYSPTLWDTLREALSQLAAGHGEALMRLADEYDQRQDDGSYTNEQDALEAIGCVDDIPVTDSAVLLDTSKRVLAAEPFADLGTGPDAVPGICAFWPVPPTSRPHQPNVNGLPPVLVVSTTGDPATPYQAGVNLARALGARLLTAQGTQHTVALEAQSPCVDAAVTRYLTDLVLPPADTRCAIPAGSS